MKCFTKLAKTVAVQAKYSKVNFSICSKFLNEEKNFNGTPYENLTVGFVQEDGETRVAQSPASVAEFVKKGFNVIFEKGSGLGSQFYDERYTEAGAVAVDTAAEVLEECDILLKVHEPTLNEIDQLKEGALTYSFLFPAQNEELVEKLKEKKITSFAMDCVPRISRAQVFDALSSQANIAGYKAVIEAANYFGNFFAGQMTAAGRINPAKVLVIGAGVAGLAAIQTAKNMGAIVRAFDTRPEVKEQIEAMGGQYLNVDFEEDGTGEGGYAKEMSPEFIEAEMALFAKQCEDIDIIVTTALIPGKPAPKLILKEHIESLKPGSVVVDLAAQTGGNIETTIPGEIYENENGVIHIGKTDFVSDVPGVASTLYSNNIRKLLLSMGNEKEQEFYLDFDDEVVRGSIITHEGELMWPPPKKEVEQVEIVEEEVEEVVEKKEMSVFTKTLLNSMVYTGTFGAIQSIGLSRDANLVDMFSIFTISCIAGYKVVSNVLPALHSPLISVTNAVSGIIVCGGLILMPDKNAVISNLGALSVLISSVNVFGGFLITQKMLNMFKKEGDPSDYTMLYGIPMLASSIAYLLLKAKGYPLISEGTNLMASVACILAIGGLCQHNTARMGNLLGITGVGLGTLATLGSLNLENSMLARMGIIAGIGGAIGLFCANAVKLTDLPQLVALFHSFVGLAACLISYGSYLQHPNAGLLHDLAISLGSYIGGVTFTGSVLAFAKLQGLMSSAPIALPGKNIVNGLTNGGIFALCAYFCMNTDLGVGIKTLSAITALSFFAGAHMTSAIGGADMPVVITVLNSFSGWALCAEGFLLNNKLLTITGALVGASGAILSAIMCVAMNRSIMNVLFQGVKKGTQKEITGTHTETNHNQVVDWLWDAQKIAIVPGFGLAVSKAQYAITDMCQKLIDNGKEVYFIIHPVAGRMPGQLNVLLAEAGIPHDIVYEMEETEEELPDTDLVLCIGSNDIYNSSANDDEGSPIYGMPVISVWESSQVVVFKRTLGSGYSAIDNPVFYNENTAMLLGDAKESSDTLLAGINDKL